MVKLESKDSVSIYYYTVEYNNKSYSIVVETDGKYGLSNMEVFYKSIPQGSMSRSVLGEERQNVVNYFLNNKTE